MLMRNYFSKLGTQVPWRTSQSRGATLALPLRYLSALFLLLTFSIGQSWAEDVTVDLALAKNTDPSPSIGAIIGTNYSKSNFDGTGYKIGSDNNSIGWDISASGKTFTAVTFNGYINTTNTSKNWGFKFSTDGGTTWGSELTQANDGTKSYHAISVTVTIPSGANAIQIIRKAGTSTYVSSITLTLASGGGGGGDPIDPTFTYTTATYTIGDPALDLSTKLSSNSSGAITFAVSSSDAGTTGASIASNKNFTATTAGTATITVSQVAATGYNAKTQDITVNVVEPDPCTTYFHFVATADATANGKTNWDGFTNAVTGSSGQTNSVTIDGTTYNLTKRTGSTGGGGTILGFTIPANKAGTLYGYMKSSGSAARTLSLKKGDDVVMTNDEIGTGGNWTLITMSNIAPGTYTLSPDQNVQVQMFVLKVCDATFHTITLDLDGGTGATSISALDGVPASKPADPTKDHCRFAGWYNGASPYDWTANVTGNLTLTAHWTQLYTVTYAAGDGSATGSAPTQEDLAAGETFSVAANPFTVDGKDFVTWNDGSADYAPSATYTMGSANVTLTAQWTAASAKYTVHYMDADGTTPLGADELVNVGNHPVGITATKPLNTFVAWQLSGSDIALDDASWASVAANAEVTLTARWAKAYATDIDFEAFIDANGTSGDWGAELSAKNYAISSTTNVTLDAPSGKPADKGLKIKNSGAYISFNVNAGKLVILKAGVLSGAEISVDGGANYTALTGATGSTAASVTSYHYNATEAEYRIRTTTGSYNIIQAITIQDPFLVTFDGNGADDPEPLYGHPSVTLPSASNGTASLLGWFDDPTDGNKIGELGDTYTPSANITLYAHWEAVSTDARISAITLNPSTGTWEPAFDPEVVNYTYTMPYGSAVVPQIESAVKHHPMASNPVIDVQASAWGETAQVHGVAQSGDTKNYYIQMLRAPKDGVEIIRATHSGAKAATVTGAIGGTYEKNTEGGGKLGSNGHFFGIKLAEGTFQAGDLLKIHATTTSPLVQIFSDKGETAIDDAGAFNAGGDYFFTLSAATEWIYLYRTSTAGSSMNPVVEYMAVYRPMDPVLTSISFNSTDVAVTGTTVSALLPNGTNLGTMTVTPTIVWNGPGTAAVTGSWAWGANTYVVTDKDGDATTYTITLTEDELKYTVSFNTHGGSAVASEEVVANGYLAAAPAAPTKDDYTFQGWSLTDGGAIIDVTTVQITEAKTFHAVWAAETGVIKLIEAGAINHTDFYTGATMSESPVEIETVDYDYAKLGSTASNPSVNQLNKLIAYNATTTMTKVMLDVYNMNTNARNVKIWGVLEGEDTYTELASIDLDNGDNKRVKTGYYEFNNLEGKNRTIYIGVPSSVGDIAFLQVKVVESGNPIHMFGEMGYSINFNKGRLFGPSANDLAFEGMTYNLSSGYQALSSASAVFTKSRSHRVDVTNAVTMTVTTANGAKFYVDQTTAGTANETASVGAHDFDLTAGTWYINVAGSNLNVTNIAFTAPKCAKPTFASLADQTICEGDPYVALNGTATVADAGVPTYQWYREDDSAIDGATAATYTPSEDGKYYVIAINHLAGYADNEAKSDFVTVSTTAGTAITSAPLDVRKNVDETADLQVVATGKNLSYKWYTCDDALGSNPAEIAGETSDTYTATVAAGVQYYKVVVSSDCGADAEAIVKVEEWVELTQQNVTATTVWDFSKTGISAETAITSDDETKLLANIAGVNNNELFRSDNIVAAAGGSNVLRTGYAQVTKLAFHTTVPGYLTVEFSNTGTKDNARFLVVNGVQTSAGSKTTGHVTYSGAIAAGDVELTVVEDNGGAGNMFRWYKVTFVKMDYYREIRPGYYGTICLEHGGKVYGAALYEVAYFNGADKIYFDEIIDGTMEPGMPYIFLPEGGSTALAVAYSEETPSAVALSKNGLHGSYTQVELTPDAGNYILLNNQYLFVNSTNVFVGANRAYIRLGEIGTTPYAPAPGRRRIAMGVQNSQVATGMENLNAGEAPMKVMINGQLFILRGENMFDATGRLVK